MSIPDYNISSLLGWSPLSFHLSFSAAELWFLKWNTYHPRYHWLFLYVVLTIYCCCSAAQSLQSCPTLCDPTEGSPPGSPVPGILQARTLEWVAFPSPMHESEKWKWSRSVVSDSQRPHGLQPTRLLRPWDFPGKSTGVGCHCLLQRFIAKSNQLC